MALFTPPLVGPTITPKDTSGLRSGAIVAVPGHPGERAARFVLDEIASVEKSFGVHLTDAYGQGHKSPGHKIFGDAVDFSGPDAAMNKAVAALTAKGYLVYYDGRFGSTAWEGHGPHSGGPHPAGSNAHFHVEFHSGPGDRGPTDFFNTPGGALVDGAGAAAGAVGDAVDAAAKLLGGVTWAFSSAGLLTIALVLGGATLAFLGLSRAAGVRAPVGTVAQAVPGLGPVATAAKGVKAAKATRPAAAAAGAKPAAAKKPTKGGARARS